jgi:hypothetical protein
MNEAVERKADRRGQVTRVGAGPPNNSKLTALNRRHCDQVPTPDGEQFTEASRSKGYILFLCCQAYVSPF